MILEYLSLESWSWLFLNLDSWNQIYSWSLKCSWLNLELKLELILECHHLCYHEVILTFELFVIIFVIIKTPRINLDSSWSLLLQIQQGLIVWILFVSLFSHFQKNRGTNCLNSFVSPFSLSKRIKRTNCLRYLLFPLTKIQRTNLLKILCLNTLKGTSFVVQVEGTSTWVVDWEQERVHLLWISSSGGYIH